MSGFKWLRILAVSTLMIGLLAGSALAAGARSGHFVTIDGKEIHFFRIDDRSSVKGWLAGVAIDVPLDTVSELVFFDSPNISYSMYGNTISSGQIELTRKNDGRKFILQDAFLPSACDCSFLSYSYRNPFTDTLSRGNIAVDGIRRIVFDNP